MRPIFLVPILFASCVLTGGAQEPSAAAMGTAAAPQAQEVAPKVEIPAADQPSREQLLQLFDIMRIRSQMATMLKAMPQAVQQQLKSEEQSVQSTMPGDSTLTPEQKAALDKVTAKYMDAAFKLYPVEEMVDDLVAVYQRHLTREDVEAITVFYKSPAGQHLLENQPAMMKEMMPQTTKKMQERARALTASYSKDLKDALNTSSPPVSK
jgi:uncharacterized protein